MAGYIATAECIEVRVDMDAEERMLYATAQPRDRYRIAAQAAAKLHAVDKILARHPQQALIIGGYVDQLKELGAHLDAPLSTAPPPPPSASASSNNSATAHFLFSWCPRWPISPSTFPRQP